MERITEDSRKLGITVEESRKRLETLLRTADMEDFMDPCLAGTTHEKQSFLKTYLLAPPAFCPPSPASKELEPHWRLLQIQDDDEIDELTLVGVIPENRVKQLACNAWKSNCTWLDRDWYVYVHFLVLGEE